MNLEREIARLGRMQSVRYNLHDRPTGRVFAYPLVEIDEQAAVAVVEVYDVVTIGGWGMVVVGIPTGPPRYGVETVNDYWQEKNHILAERQTRDEVEAGRWTWGRGNGENHFAIAAIVTGTRHLIPEYALEWWNRNVPTEILRARSLDENYQGLPVTLRLTMGKV